jgi:two-component sensor histidine kinase
VNEQERLAIVRRYDILDTPPDEAFDRVTRMAARLLKMQAAFISIVDEDRIWFKSRQGVDVGQMRRDSSLCTSCIHQEEPLLIADTRVDSRTSANPPVIGELHIRFYLGTPLRTRDGFNLGTLCVVDRVPRTVSDAEVTVLVDLAAVVMDELEFRLAAKRAEQAYRDELARAELREDYISGLTRELVHRSKNLLTVVHSIARQTKSNSHSISDYVQRLAGRILGLAETHDLISQKEWHGVTLSDLAWRHLDPFLESEASVNIEGPTVTLTPIAAQNIGLALHELATNALKFGSLSVQEGRVVVHWLLFRESDRLFLSWEEENCPASDKQQNGFGRLVLEEVVPVALEGTANLSFETGCLKWVLEVPAHKVLSST